MQPASLHRTHATVLTNWCPTLQDEVEVPERRNECAPTNSQTPNPKVSPGPSRLRQTTTPACQLPGTGGGVTGLTSPLAGPAYRQLSSPLPMTGCYSRNLAPPNTCPRTQVPHTHQQQALPPPAQPPGVLRIPQEGGRACATLSVITPTCLKSPYNNHPAHQVSPASLPPDRHAARRGLFL